jgi:MFS family permease
MRPMGWLAMLSCAPLIISLLHPPFWLLLGLWGLAGAGGAYQLAAAAAFVRALQTPGRARAFGVAQSGLLAAQGLGILAAGALAERVGPQAAVALAGLLGVVLAALLATGWTRQRTEMLMAQGEDVPETTQPERGPS